MPIKRGLGALGWHVQIGRNRWTTSTLLVLAGMLLSCGEAGASTPTAYAGPEGPDDVSVHAADVTASQAYELLFKASGVRVRTDRGVSVLDRRISFSIVREPFWVALRRINDKAEMRISQVLQDDGPEVTLLPAAIVSNHRTVGSSIDGPFLATLIDSTVQRGQEKTIEPTRIVQSQLTLEVRPDPRLKAMLFEELKVDELIDESGRAIGATTTTKAFSFRDGLAGIGIKLQGRPGPRRVGRMKLGGRAMIATRWETVEVGNLDSAQPSTTYAAGFRIVTRARDRGDARHITMEFTRTGSAGPTWLKEPTRIVLLKPMFVDRHNHPTPTVLYDADWFGKMFRVEVEASVHQTPGGINPKDVDRLRMEIPTDVKYYDLHWEFSDLALI